MSLPTNTGSTETVTLQNSLEVAWCPNVSLCQLLPLALDLLFLLGKATVHHVIHVGIVVEAHVVYLRILDVHRRHRESGSWAHDKSY